MKTHPKGYANALIRKIMLVYSIFLVLFGLLASYMAYDKESNAMRAELNQAMSELDFAYESSTKDFWRSYVPIVRQGSDVYNILKEYFELSTDRDLTQMERISLNGAIQTLMAYNHGVSWIGLYTEKREVNYIKFSSGSIVPISENFPFADKLKDKPASMEVYGGGLLEYNEETIRTFALCGNASINSDGGVILFGYETDATYSRFENTTKIDGVNYYVVNEHGILFDSSGQYDGSILPLVQGNADFVEKDGVSLRIYRLQGSSGDHRVFCTIPKWQEQVEGHTYSPYILVVVILFWLCSMVIYRWTGKGIMKKIDVIQNGLHAIGDSNLEYRIPVSGTPGDEFEDIGRAINEMTAQLQENIHKTYELRLQQRETELSELQAKFDPHFLYNTLEVIRGKVYDNGDVETSDVITKMAQLFRTLLNGETFVTVRDEVDYCNAYLSLMEYRYDDRIDVIYDIDSDVMQYGIIRNLLQPLLENFFVHGIDEGKYKHTLHIRGKVYDEEYIWFYLQNDGLTIPEKKLEKLQESLRSGNAMGYGLQNVQRRTKLFYGSDCGLVLRNNPDGGVTVELKIRKLTCEEHIRKLNNG